MGALASNDLVSTAFATLLDQEVYAISMDVIATKSSLGALGEGPLIIGVAHSDYTAAEIEEWLEASASWAKGNKIAQEQARRKCRQIGIFGSVDETDILNDGKPLRVKLGFPIESGSGLQLWVFNDSGSTMTTGTTIELAGKAFLAPR